MYFNKGIDIYIFEVVICVIFILKILLNVGIYGYMWYNLCKCIFLFVGWFIICYDFIV